MVWDIGKVEFRYISENLCLKDSNDFNRESRALFRLDGKKISGDFLLQYNMIKKKHIYWSLKSINDSFNLKVPGEFLNHSALSGSSLEFIREETKRNK